MRGHRGEGGRQRRKTTAEHRRANRGTTISEGNRACRRPARAGDVHDRIDMLVPEPVAGNRCGAVGAVLVVGDEDFNRRPEDTAAEILDRHLCCRRAADAGGLGIGAGHVEEEADLDHPVGNPRRAHRLLCAGAAPRAREEDRRHGGEKQESPRCLHDQAG